MKKVNIIERITISLSTKKTERQESGFLLFTYTSMATKTLGLKEVGLTFLVLVLQLRQSEDALLCGAVFSIETPIARIYVQSMLLFQSQKGSSLEPMLGYTKGIILRQTAKGALKQQQQLRI
eukprot:235022_1